MSIPDLADDLSRNKFFYEFANSLKIWPFKFKFFLLYEEKNFLVKKLYIDKQVKSRKFTRLGI